MVNFRVTRHIFCVNEEVSDILGRKYTVSIALPGSILDNAQTPQLKAYLAGQVKTVIISRWLSSLQYSVSGSKIMKNGLLLNIYLLQIARAAVIYNIDEIIVFDETGSGKT